MGSEGCEGGMEGYGVVVRYIDLIRSCCLSIYITPHQVNKNIQSNKSRSTNNTFAIQVDVIEMALQMVPRSSVIFVNLMDGFHDFLVRGNF